MNPFYIGFPAWLVCAFSAYGLREKAIGQLSAEQVGTLALAQRADRINQVAFSVGILVVFLTLRFGLPERQNLWFLLLLIVAAAVSVYFGVRGCKAVLLLAPPGPARTLIASRLLGLLGLFSLAGAMAATVL